MASPMILALLSNLNTRVATNETNIAANTTAINTNKGLFDTHTADNTKHWTTQDRQNFDRVVHFKGYYTTKTALEQAYPTGQTGDYAIVGATDTVWAWDDTTNKWINTAQQGVVISVNGRTGEVILTKTDVGLSNVDNTADVNKPISTLQQAALDNKANKGLITSAQADSATLKSGIYYLNSAYTIKDDVDVMYWTIIHSCGVDKSSGTGVIGENAFGSQIWINYTTNGSGKIYYRRQQYNYTTGSADWSEFKEIMTNTDFESLQTGITTNANGIIGLRGEKADRREITEEEIDDIDIGAGIYSWTSENYPVYAPKGQEAEEFYSGTVIIGSTVDQTTNGSEIEYEYVGSSQIFIPSEQSTPRIFFRDAYYEEEFGVWMWRATFSELPSLKDYPYMKSYKGQFSSFQDLEISIPEGEFGDFALIVANNAGQFYFWDSNNESWAAVAGGGGGGAVSSVNGMTGDVVLTKSNIGLTNVDNTADANKNVNSAATLTTARTIDGMSFNGSSNIIHYGTCSGSSSILNATFTVAPELTQGAHISVKFSSAAPDAAPIYLKINNGTMKEIKAYGTTSAERGFWRAGEVVDFTFDGNYWCIHKGAAASASYFGAVKIAGALNDTYTTQAINYNGFYAGMQNFVTGVGLYKTSGTNYVVGDRVIHNGQLYECISATSGSWSGSKWKIISPLQTQIDSLLGNLYDSFDEYSIGQPYAEGSLVIYEGKLYKCIEAMSSSGIWNSTQWESTTLIRILNEFPIKMGASKTANFLDSYLNVVGTYNTKDGTLTVPEVVETRGTIIRGNATETSVFDSIVFPETVTFTNRIEMSYYGAYCDVEDPTQPIFIIDFSPNTFSLTDLSTGLPIVTYESLGSDAGYVYTRTSSDDYFDIGTTVEFFSDGGMYQWTDSYGAFLQVEVNE